MKKESRWEKFCDWLESLITTKDIEENPYTRNHIEKSREERRRWEDKMRYLHDGGHMRWNR